MYALYVANKNYSSWSLRPWSLLRTLGIPFEEKYVPFETGSSYGTFRKFSPTGKVPCLVDGSTVVWDSLAIAEYIAERHPAAWPADAVARAWARSASAEMHSGFAALRSECSMSIGVRIRLHAQTEALRRDIARIDELWSEGQSRFGGPFIAGATFTIADAFFVPVAFRVRTYGLALGATAAAYGQRLLALPASLAWEADALAETWREFAHEQEILASGTVLEDLRAAPH
jgi:glutathione S-transferase